jgi:hypothetical protein
MLGNRRSMQALTLGELQQSIATLILSYELIDLFRLESALHLPLPHSLFHASADVEQQAAPQPAV